MRYNYHHHQVIIPSANKQTQTLDRLRFELKERIAMRMTFCFEGLVFALGGRSKNKKLAAAKAN